MNDVKQITSPRRSVSEMFKSLLSSNSKPTTLPRIRSSEDKEATQINNRVKWEVILKNWPQNIHTSKKFSTMCFAGIPTSLRSAVWPRIIGNDLQITKQLYEELVACSSAITEEYIIQRNLEQKKAIEDKNAYVERRQEYINALQEFGIKDDDLCKYVVDYCISQSTFQQKIDNNNEDNTPLTPVTMHKKHLSQIERDMNRTFPNLKFFHQPDGALYEPFLRLLHVYVCFRPEVGYVQGMSYVAAMLLLNVDEYEAFVVLVNLLEQPLYQDFFSFESKNMKRHIKCFDLLLAKYMPDIWRHFKDQGVECSMFLFEWFFTMFTRSLRFEVAHRIWDNFFLHGGPFLFRTGLGMIRMMSTTLLSSRFENIVQLLQRPPQDLDVDHLFQNIASIPTITNDDLHNIAIQLKKQQEEHK